MRSRHSIPIALVAFVTSSCVYPGVYYLPTGPGERIGSGSPKDTLVLPVAEGVDLCVSTSTASFHDGVGLRFQLIVRQGHEARFLDDTITVEDLEGGETRTARFDKIVSRPDTFRAFDRIAAWPERPRFGWIDIHVAEFRPRAFELRVPEIEVDGTPVVVAPVTFRFHRGLVFSPEAQ